MYIQTLRLVKGLGLLFKSILKILFLILATMDLRHYRKICSTRYLKVPYTLGIHFNDINLTYDMNKRPLTAVY